MTVARCLRFTVRQGLAIRGDGDEMDSNFHQPLILKGFDDVTIHVLLAKKQDKYTSPQIQNELLQTMALSIIRDIRGGGSYCTFLNISCFYHSENMYWVTLNVKIYLNEFLTPHNPPVHTP